MNRRGFIRAALAGAVAAFAPFRRPPRLRITRVIRDAKSVTLHIGPG